MKPLFVGAPPWAVSPTKPVAPVRASVIGATSTPASVPPNVTWKPVSSNVPAPKPATATVPPAGRMPAEPFVVSATVPAAPFASVTVSGSTSTPASVPPKSRLYPVSATAPTVTVAPAGQVASAGPPLRFSRTAEVHAPVQLTIDSGATSVPAAVPAKVTVKPVLLAPVTVAVPAPVIALIAGERLAALTASPPAPNTLGDVVAPTASWNDWVVALKEPSVTVWDSLPPVSAAAMPAAVLFWPRTIGTEVAPL